MIWSWMLAVLNLGIRRLNFGSRLTAYLADSILPFYVLHHPVVVIVASAVVGLPLGVWPKFLLVAAVSLAITLCVYELGVRRWPPTRFLFGLKPLPAPASQLRELAAAPPPGRV
jgi:surface polysaccharide O-acyltransferase-like enzyme